eukprot:4785079-Amphidinium_carterae.2
MPLRTNGSATAIALCIGSNSNCTGAFPRDLPMCSKDQVSLALRIRCCTKAGDTARRSYSSPRGQLSVQGEANANPRRQVSKSKLAQGPVTTCHGLLALQRRLAASVIALLSMSGGNCSFHMHSAYRRKVDSCTKCAGSQFLLATEEFKAA